MKRYILILIAITATAACVDNESIDGPNDGFETQTQAIVVHPEFRIQGTSNVPDSLLVRELDLTVSEIRFAPAIGNDLAYSTQEPMLVTFDLEAGEEAKVKAPLELPEAGRYIVSIRLEPTGEQSHSFEMNGYVDEVANGMVQDDKQDGTPQPILFNEKREQKERDIQVREETAKSWTPFKYQSRRSVFYTFNDVSFEEGEQYLTFNFDVEAWSGNVIDSITKAVRNTAPEAAKEVDVTKTLESNGDDFERLIETGTVQSSGGF